MDCLQSLVIVLATVSTCKKASIMCSMERRCSINTPKLLELHMIRSRISGQKWNLVYAKVEPRTVWACRSQPRSLTSDSTCSSRSCFCGRFSFPCSARTWKLCICHTKAWEATSSTHAASVLSRSMPCWYDAAGAGRVVQYRGFVVGFHASGVGVRVLVELYCIGAWRNVSRLYSCPWICRSV